MYMPGTVAPEEAGKQGMQAALIDALRQQQGGAKPQQQLGGVTSAGALGDGMNVGAIGGALGSGISGIGQNLATANTYGTTPFSQQTNMLAAQDRAFL